MCSIMGYCSPSAVYEVFMRGFQRTISRGPDASKVVDTGEGYLGFHRLAIMGMTTSGMQPFHATISDVDVEIGDIVGGRDRITGMSLQKPIVNKILRMNNGIPSVEYKLKGEE